LCTRVETKEHKTWIEVCTKSVNSLRPYLVSFCSSLTEEVLEHVYSGKTIQLLSSELYMKLLSHDISVYGRGFDDQYESVRGIGDLKGR